ncbi:MAG: FAD-dependent oxidoreductase [Alphaproteobacteria bacterium]|nr:FAD-dependent oxidoreductase [Alphaproteobacteria bacterium]
MRIGRRKLLQLGAVGTASFASGVLASVGASKANADVLDIVVIGAGISGLSAGWELKKSGIKSFAVIEARDRVGGRTFNETVNGQPVDAGATWIGPGQTAMYDLCRELGLEVFGANWKGDYLLVNGGDVMRMPGPPSAPIQNPALAAKVEALAKTVPLGEPWKAPDAAKLDATTFAQYLKAEGMPDEELGVLNPFSALTFGANADQMSMLYVLHYIHAAGSYALLEDMEGGAQQDRIKDGSQAVSLALSERLGDAVRLGHAVNAIAGWDGDGLITIETSKGTIKTRRVILALSPSQAAEIAFSPALPPARQAILDGWPRDGSGFTMHFGYKTPFWRKAGLSGLAIELQNNAPTLIADLSPEDGSTGIIKMLGVAGVGGTPAARKDATLRVLIKCFGPEAANPTEWVFQDWSKEQFTRGCVSPVGPGFLSKLDIRLDAPTGALHWAGTETATIWMGYMDGAVRAGRRAAVETLGSLI